MADPLSARRPSSSSRAPRLLVPFVVLVVVVLALLGSGVELYTDLLWFQSVGFSDVFTTVLGTRVLLFVVFGAAMAVIVGANLVVAHRLRPPFTPMSLEQQNLERYRSVLEPRLLGVVLLLASVVGIFAGLAASARWETWLQWRNAEQFGVVDEQFGRDISYFAFTYPFQRFVLGFLFAAVVLSILAALAVHYVFGAVRLQTPGEKVTPGARGHIAVLLGLFVLLKAYAYYLDRYGLAFSEQGVVTGPSYTDVNAVLPVKTFLVAAAIVSALLFFGAAVRRGWLLPGLSFGLLVFSAVVIGGIVPAAVQQFRVNPNEQELEQPFIDRNIAATRAAYGIDDETVEVSEFAGVTDPEAVAPALNSNPGDVATAARLLDPAVLGPTFQQLQQLRRYFGFQDELDVDRYDLGDGDQQYVVAARELDLAGVPAQDRNWISDHLLYTHGRGFVAAPAESADANGRPRFVLGAIPPTGAEPLDVEQSRIYFGELSPDYSIAPSDRDEIDGPGTAGGGEAAQEFNKYDGSGGVAVGSFFRQVLYGLKFQEANFLLTDSITEDSKILYVRNPRDRVSEVAPWLTLDGDPYPAVIDGRVTWILDGYTTTNGYPYSERTVLGEVAADALTGTASRAALPENQVNYIRNSVKATVDAYDGTVSLYEFDQSDPVLQTWMKAFPDTVRPFDDMSPELREHLRYPQDLFKVQRELLTRYHVEDPTAFYTREDFWRVPPEPTASGQGAPDQPPFYLQIQLPGTEEASFQLTSVFNAVQRPNLTAFMAASSDPDDYGRIRLLRLPQGSAVPGPGQVQNAFSSNAEVGQVLNILRQGDSDVVFGNLLTLPIGDGLLYVSPVYVRATGGESFPLLRRVLVGFGEDQVAFEETLEEALAVLFGEAAPSLPTDQDPEAVPTPAPGVEESPGPDVAPGGDLRAALDDLERAFNDSQAALRAGDLAAYAEAQERLADAVQRALAAESEVTTPPGSSDDAPASPSPAASPSG